MKPEHLILSDKGLHLVDYGSAYQLKRGRMISLLFCDPIFASRMEFTKFGNPVSLLLHFILEAQFIYFLK